MADSHSKIAVGLHKTTLSWSATLSRVYALCIRAVDVDGRALRAFI
jgi:hypothetical protein